MAYLEPKLVTKLAQKQVLTPGLVQMVSLLTLNKLELTEMIQQELVQNPVLEEGTEIVESTTPEIELGQEGPEQSGQSSESDADGTDAEYQALKEAEERDHCVTEPEATAETTVEVAAPAEPEAATDDPYGDIDFQSFDQYLNDGASRPRGFGEAPSHVGDGCRARAEVGDDQSLGARDTVVGYDDCEVVAVR